MGDLRQAIHNEAKWTETWNGCDTLKTTESACLDLFGRAGAMRSAGEGERETLFSQAFKEDADIAVKLLFYTRDVRGGYGERDTFNIMFKALARINTESVTKNLWAVLEFGRAKDLYGLIGTPAEKDMWEFMKAQFEMDLANMEEGKSISLLAKWIATPDSKSERTRELGKITAKHLGYTFKTMREYKTKLRALRKYLDLPEAKMCSGAWDEIEYSKCASRFLLKNRRAIAKHDEERWNKFIEKVDNGEEQMHMGTNTPCDIMYEVLHNYTTDLETMWKNLPDVCEGNALIMCDTSGSMTSNYNSKSKVRPIDVALGLSIYFAQRNKGCLKDMMMNFSDKPEFVELNAATLYDNYRIAMECPVNYSSTNLEAAFDLLLKVATKNKLDQEDFPDAIVIVSDMQINCVEGVDRDNNMTFYDVMKDRYEKAGYSLPQVVFWNVNAQNPTFHASMTAKGVSMVSGYSTNIFKQVMENIGSTPYELMMRVVESERYKDITA